MAKDKRVLQARNEEALQKAQQRLDDATETVADGESQIENLSGDFRTMAEKILKSARNKRDFAAAAVEKLSRSPEERRADQIRVRNETSEAFERHGFEYHDTGADVGTVVWKQGPVRVTLRPTDPGHASILIAKGTLDGDAYEALAMSLASL